MFHNLESPETHLIVFAIHLTDIADWRILQVISQAIKRIFILVWKRLAKTSHSDSANPLLYAKWLKCIVELC